MVYSIDILRLTLFGLPHPWTFKTRWLSHTSGLITPLHGSSRSVYSVYTFTHGYLLMSYVSSWVSGCRINLTEIPKQFRSVDCFICETQSVFQQIVGAKGWLYLWELCNSCGGRGLTLSKIISTFGIVVCKTCILLKRLIPFKEFIIHPYFLF